MSFTHRQVVEFQHCDPAGIVFYPRYFEMISSTVERFFTDALGADFGEMHVTRRMGVPMARIEVDFTAPSRLGDRLALDLDVSHLGGSSATLAIICICGDQVRFRAKGTIVHVNLATGRPVRWPPELREALSRYLAG